MRNFAVGCTALLLLLPIHASAQNAGSGTVVLLLGLCNGSLYKSFTIDLRNTDGKEKLSVSVPRDMIFGGPMPIGGWKDATGTYNRYNLNLAAGEWEIYNHSMVSKTEGSTGFTTTRQKADHSHRFQVPANGVTYLGRYCAASQNDAYEWDFGPKGTKGIKMGYVLATSSLDVDVKNANLTVDATAVVNGAPADPSAVTTSWKGAFVEPREVVVKKTVGKQPCTDPVQPCN
jgi:hypothetical protein